MNHAEDRVRKLLLHKREILKLGGRPPRGASRSAAARLLQGRAREAGDRPRSRQERPRQARRNQAEGHRAGYAPGDATEGSGRQREKLLADTGRRRGTSRPAGCPRPAMPFSTMSNPVPWSTDVRTNGRPSVTFTAWPNEASFTGISPGRDSRRPPRRTRPRAARTNTVRGQGPHVDAFGAQRRDRRAEHVAVLVAEQPALARVRVQAAERDPPFARRNAAARGAPGGRSAALPRVIASGTERSE